MIDRLFSRDGRRSFIGSVFALAQICAEPRRRRGFGRRLYCLYFQPFALEGFARFRLRLSLTPV